MIIKVYNDLETKLLSKVVSNKDEQVKEVYSQDGTLFMKHYMKNNVIVKSEKFNTYGDVISFGNYVNNILHSSGCLYNHTRHEWIKSPHFQHGSVFGLAAVYDVNHEVVFYGWMFNDNMVREEHVYHPYLHHEYFTVQKYKKQDEHMEKQLYKILDSQEDVIPVKL